MNKKRHSVIVCCYVLLSFFTKAQTRDLSAYVNPFIGTGGTGHTFPGAVLPFGMVQLSPDTRIDGSWEGCSGYYYSDAIIYGFSHTHLSGTGVSDYGDILLMPTVGDPSIKNKDYSSSFSHATEKASPGYYAVRLDDGNINIELTATNRVGIHRYTFPATDKANVIIDLLHRDKTLDCSLTVIDSVTIIGSRISEGWANRQHVYFAIQFSQPFKKNGLSVMKEAVKFPQNKNSERTEAGFFQFDTKANQQLIVRVAISQTGTDGALKNLREEAPHADFDLYRTNAVNTWNKELSKIQVYDKDEEKLKIFYTALYHCMTHPSLAADVDGKYRGRDQKIHEASGYTPYTVFSLWDTFRGLHPLFTIIDQKRTNDFVNTFLKQYEESGRLPMWELSSNETNCMIGFHSVSVVADAYTKGTRGYDINKAYEAMCAAANYTDAAIPVFNKNNYLQIDDESESVSKTLEYGYDNWCIAQVAKALKKNADYNLYLERAQAYKNLFDIKTGFIRARKNGNWLSPFDPKEVNNYYTEANGWQYTFFVPQDIDGLFNLMGGNEQAGRKLDELFTTSSATSGRTQVDITGLIGQYAHGNEPSHHMAYLYNYIGKPYKTQQKVYQIVTEFYKNAPDGLIGNEDCGQMSAWYVLSTMGFYPVCPGRPEYAIGTPAFDSVSLHLENGHTFTITKNSDQGFYIQSCRLNNKSWAKSYIPHSAIVNGGSLEFTMSSTPDTTGFGEGPANSPHSALPARGMVMTPIIIAEQKLIEKATPVTIETSSNKEKIVYTTNGTEPVRTSRVYNGPFLVDTTCTIKAKAYVGSDSSSTTVSNLYKRPNNWKISITGNYNKQYDAGGDIGLIDGQKGTTNWRSGGWQGYQGQDFECVIDLQKPHLIQHITSTFLQDSRSWIIFPKQVEYYVSDDGKNYKLFGSLENGVAPDDYSVQIRAFGSNSVNKTPARYIKIKAKNFDKLPQWHQGYGGEAFIFIDEIEVR